MANKKELSAMADVHSESMKRTMQDQYDANDFSIGFDSADVQMTTRGGKVHVTAHIDKESFNKILYTNAAYIYEFLKTYGV